MKKLTGQDLISEIRALSGTPHLVVRVYLDIDSTLLHVHKRNEAIFRSFLKTHSSSLKSLINLSSLEHLEFQPTDWGWRDPLDREGTKLPPPWPDRIQNYWESEFFSSKHLHHDLEFGGSLNFIEQLLLQTPAEVIYLTGRDLPRMGSGTHEDLMRRGYLKGPRTQLLLKPQTTIPDAEFKASVFSKLSPSNGVLAYFIDNEPINLWAAQPFLDPSHLLFMESVHSKAMEPSESWRRISNWWSS